MSDNGRPFDFGQFGGASAPANPPSPAGPPGGTNPFGGANTGQSLQSAAAQSGFGASTPVSGGNYDGGSASLHPTSAPVVWLYAAIAASIIAMFVALFLGDTPFLAIGAWALAGPVAIALVAVFSFRDTRARTAALYSSSDFVTWLYRGAIVLSLIAVVISALKIADWVGRI